MGNNSIRRCLELLLVLACTGACGDSTSVDGSLLEYRAPIAASFAEVSTSTLKCTTYSTLSGTVRIRLNKPGSLVDADAGVDITERIVSVSPRACGQASREVKPLGEWTAPINGTASQFNFVIRKSGSNNQQTVVRFDGTYNEPVITGVLEFTRTSNQAAGTLKLPVSLRVTPGATGAVSGTWTGSLTLVTDSGTLNRGTTITLSQNGSALTGHLQFSGGEVVSIEGSVSGSAVAITATPRPAADECHRYSFGIVFAMEASQLKALTATGTGCEPGGQRLLQFTGASGVLNRS